MLEARDYQTRGLENARQCFRHGNRSVCMVAPTGAGKTVMIALAAVGHAGREGRTVILVHRAELIRQTLDKLWRAGLRDLGAIAADGGFNENARVVVCSVQTLLARELRPQASLLIPDECHHFLADEWSRVARHYEGVPTLGFTATPVRADGTALGNMFDSLIVVASPAELVSAGHLVPCEVFGPPARLKKTDIVDPVTMYEKHGEGRPFVLFAGSREHGRQLAERFGVPYVDGTTRNREEILKRFQDEGRGLVNVFVLTEGWDCPRVEVCIIARGCQSAGTFLQMVGRIRRTMPGKTRSLLLDCKGAVFEHGLPDCERVYSLEGNPIRVKDGLPPLRTCPACAAVFEMAPQCARCGHRFAADKHEAKHVASETRTVTVDNVTSEIAKRAFLRAQLTQAKAFGRKPGWAVYRFRWRFGHWPPPQWLKEEQPE